MNANTQAKRRQREAEDKIPPKTNLLDMVQLKNGTWIPLIPGTVFWGKHKFWSSNPDMLYILRVEYRRYLGWRVKTMDHGLIDIKDFKDLVLIKEPDNEDPSVVPVNPQ